MVEIMEMNTEELFIRLFLLVLHYLKTVTGSCSKPVLKPNTYALTEDKSSYAVNETYEIYCIPGYVTSGGSNLVCVSSNTWSISPPECTASGGTYPWWMLLVAVLLVILVVSCILPRLLQCCFSKTKKKVRGNEERDLERNNETYDDNDDDDSRANSPVPDWSKQKKMSNIEFMAKLHEGADKKTLKRAQKNSTF